MPEKTYVELQDLVNDLEFDLQKSKAETELWKRRAQRYGSAWNRVRASIKNDARVLSQISLRSSNFSKELDSISQ